MLAGADQQRVKRDELDDWLQFIRGESHILKERPGLLFQHAANQSESTSPAQYAQRRSEAGLEARPWLRWLNKPGRRSSCLLTLAGHTSKVLACAWSTDGRHVVSGSRDGTIKFWDTASGHESLSLAAHAGAIEACVFAPNGSFVLTASEDRTLKLWDAHDGSEVLTLTGHTRTVTSCAFIDQGARVVSGSADGTLKIWDSTNGRELATLPGHSGEVRCLAVSANGRTIVSGGRGANRRGEVRLWDSVRCCHLESLLYHHWFGDVVSCGFWPDDSRVWAAANVETVMVWDMESFEEVFGFYSTGQGTTLTCVLAPDGSQFVTAGYLIAGGGILNFWDSATGEQLDSLPAHASMVTGCAYSADGAQLVTGSEDSTVKVWTRNAMRAVERTGHNSEVTDCVYSPNNSRFLSAALGEIKVWDARVSAEQAVLEGRSPCAVSPDGSLIAARSTYSLKLWEAENTGHTADLPYQHRRADGALQTLSFSPDGTRLLSSSWDHTLRIWDTTTHEVIATLTGHNRRLRAAEFSPDGSRILSSAGWYDEENELKMWDARSGRSTATMPVDGRLINSIGFFPDGNLMFSAGGTWSGGGDPRTAYCELRLWHSHSGQKFRAHSETGKSNIVSCACSPDGRRLLTISRDGVGQVWDVRLLTEVLRFEGVEAPGKFSLDGTLIVAGGAGSLLKVWEAATGSEIGWFSSGARLTAFSFGGLRKAAYGDRAGRITLLQLEGVITSAPLVTAIVYYLFDRGEYASAPATRCPLCGAHFSPSARTIDVIRCISPDLEP